MLNSMSKIYLQKLFTTINFIEENRTEVLPHPSYSLDLTSYNLIIRTHRVDDDSIAMASKTPFSSVHSYYVC